MQDNNTSKTSKLLLYVLILMLVVTAAFGGVYFAKDKDFAIINNKGVTTETALNNGTQTTSPSATTTSGQKPDVDAEIKAMDSTVNSISTNDFSDDTLSDSQLGL